MEGTPFGRYLLIEQLGRGGMGEVWRAHDTAIDRTVALKMLLPHFAQDKTFEQRFRREARAAARLDDPHVVPIHDVGEIDGRLYVTMRLINGQDLQSLLDTGPLEPQRAVAIIDQVAKALGSAHRAGLVHRDVKPSNILLTEDDFAYLIDFGIARAAGETALTNTGTTIGTWSYMAPERFSTGETKPSSDIYALTCVLYQCLTGELPFPVTTLEQIVVAHMVTPPPQASSQRATIPTTLDHVIATGLAKDPAHRYATTGEFAAAARDAITTPIPRRRPPPPPPPPPPRPPINQPAPPPPGPYQPANVAAPWPVAGSPAHPWTPPPAPPHAPASPATARAPAWRRKGILIPAAVLGAVIIAIATIVLVSSNSGSGSETTSSPSASVAAPTSAAPAILDGPPVTLGFTGFSGPYGVAVNSTGTVYVVDVNNKRVVSLPAGSSSQTVLPFTGLNGPEGAAVDSSGALYIADTYNKRVLKLAAGASSPDVLPFTGLDSPTDVAVDSARNVYVTDFKTNKVFKLDAGSSNQTLLPFTGLNTPEGVAVDSSGTVYLCDYGNNRLLKLPAGSSNQTVLPFNGLYDPEGVAVDSAGTLFVTDGGNNRVLRLVAGSSSQTVLPFSGLNNPTGVAVDSSGSVYLTDYYNNRVLKIQAR